MSKLESFGQMALDGTAGYGQLITTVGFCFILFIFLLTVYLVNKYLYNKEDVYDNNYTQATVKDSKCTQYIKKTENTSDMNWDCSMNLLYTINNKNYVKDHHINSTTYYSPNTQIDLRYNKYDYNNITTDTYSNDFKGNVIIFIVFIFLILSSVSLYSVYKWKIVAAATGAGSLAGSVASKISGGINSGNNGNSGNSGNDVTNGLISNNGIVSNIIQNTLRGNRIL